MNGKEKVVDDGAVEFEPRDNIADKLIEAPKPIISLDSLELLDAEKLKGFIHELDNTKKYMTEKWSYYENVNEMTNAFTRFMPYKNSYIAVVKSLEETMRGLGEINESFKDVTVASALEKNHIGSRMPDSIRGMVIDHIADFVKTFNNIPHPKSKHHMPDIDKQITYINKMYKDLNESNSVIENILLLRNINKKLENIGQKFYVFFKNGFKPSPTEYITNIETLMSASTGKETIRYEFESGTELIIVKNPKNV